jgi:hypothetical protein
MQYTGYWDDKLWEGCRVQCLRTDVLYRTISCPAAWENRSMMVHTPLFTLATRIAASVVSMAGLHIAHRRELEGAKVSQSDPESPRCVSRAKKCRGKCVAQGEDPQDAP